MKELKVDEWIDEIDDGLKYRRLYGLEDSWPALEQLFYSVHPSNLYAGDNIIQATGDSLLSQLNVPEPHVMVKPTRPDISAAAMVLEAVDNKLIKETKLSREVDKASLHAFLWSRGILKFGFDSEFGYDPEFVLGEDLGLTMTQFDLKERRIEFSSAKPGMPWVAACLPHDIVVPYGTIDIDSAPWIAHRIVRHVEDIKSDVKYSNKKDLKPVISMDDFTKSYQSTIKPYRVGHYDKYFSGEGKSDYCELWEIHDQRTKKIYVIATGHDKFIRNDEDLLQINGLPFVSFGFIPNARTFWTTPMAYFLKPHQAELSDITRIASKQRRLSVLKFLYHEGAFGEGELDKILGVDCGVGAEVTQNTELAQAIAFITAPNNNQMLYSDAEQVRGNARDTVGFSRNQQGEFAAKSRITATEVNVVKQGGDLRLSRKGKLIKEVYEEAIGKKINPIIFEFWKTIRWTEVAGPDGAKWIEYTGAMLKGDYSYDVKFAPANLDSVEARKQMALQMYAALSQDPNIDPIKLRAFLVNAFNDQEFSDLFGGVQNMALQTKVSGNENANIPTLGKTLPAAGGGIAPTNPNAVV